MGLKTFSLMMLVMNMAFLRSEEVNKFLRLLQWRSETGETPRQPATTEGLGDEDHSRRDIAQGAALPAPALKS
jgi:hypothetical protein